MLFCCTVPPSSKETELGSSNQEASPWAGKNTWIVLVPCLAGKVSLRLFPVVWIFSRSLSVICSERWIVIKGHKNYVQDWCLMNSQPTFLFFNLFLTQWIMAILSKEYKPDNFKSHNSLKISFTNIWGPCSIFVHFESFLESNSPYILALCETNLNDSIDSGCLYEGLSSFNLKRFYYSYYIVLQFIWKKDFLLHRTYL